jgi:hypothetical protein
MVMLRFLSHTPVVLAFPPSLPLLVFALNLPCRLATAADALSGMDNTDLLLHHLLLPPPPRLLCYTNYSTISLPRFLGLTPKSSLCFFFTANSHASRDRVLLEEYYRIQGCSASLLLKHRQDICNIATPVFLCF